MLVFALKISSEESGVNLKMCVHLFYFILLKCEKFCKSSKYCLCM